MQNRKTVEQNSLAWVVFLLIAIFGHAVHAEEKPSFSLEGFATIKAYGINTTTGGVDRPHLFEPLGELVRGVGLLV